MPDMKTEAGNALDLVLDMELPVSISFGRTELTLEEVLNLTTGSLIELSRSVDDPVDIVVNGRVIARGEVVEVEGNYGVRVQQITGRVDRPGSGDAAAGPGAEDRPI
jgi:flagellar motor switch protein FliN/FliY